MLLIVPLVTSPHTKLVKIDPKVRLQPRIAHNLASIAFRHNHSTNHFTQLMDYVPIITSKHMDISVNYKSEKKQFSQKEQLSWIKNKEPDIFRTDGRVAFQSHIWFDFEIVAAPLWETVPPPRLISPQRDGFLLVGTVHMTTWNAFSQVQLCCPPKLYCRVDNANYWTPQKFILNITYLKSCECTTTPSATQNKTVNF